MRAHRTLHQAAALCSTWALAVAVLVPLAAGATPHLRQLLQAASLQDTSTTLDVDARTRGYWRELTQTICPQRKYTSCNGMDRSQWTDASRSQFTRFDFQGLGAWSTFRIITYDFHGRRRARGGDSWYVVLLDRRRGVKVPARVFDEGDGTYTGAAFFLRPGSYAVVAWLWYSDCHGLQEPTLPIDEYTSERWFGVCVVGQSERRGPT